MTDNEKRQANTDNKLAPSLVRLCLVIMIATLIITLSVITFANVFFVKHENEEEADEYLNYLVNAFKVPLWNLDTRTTKDICASALLSEYLVYLEVKDDAGNIICEHNKGARRFVIRRTGLIRYNDILVGSLLFEISYASEFSYLMKWLCFALVIICFGLAAVIIAIHFFVQSNIAKPLEELFQYLQMISEGNYRIPVKKFKYAEFATVMNFMKNMALKIENREKSLKEMTNRLRDEIKHREEALNALKLSEEKFRAVMHAAGDGVIIARPDGFIEYVNRATEVIWGAPAESIAGFFVCDLFPEDCREKLRRYVTDESSNLEEPLDLTIRRADGKNLDVEITVSKALYGQDRTDARVVMIIRDISLRKQMEREREEMQEHMYRLQKVEAIGTLAAGIAHDFNNILTAIMGFAELAKSACKDNPAVCGYIEQIEAAGNSARDLIRQIFSISRPQPSALVYFNLEALVKETVKFLRSTIPSCIEMQLDIQNDGLIVRGDPSKIQQIIINLCTNAVQAMENMDHGVLRVSLRREILQLPTKSVCGILSPGEYICIEVEDTGTGISPENLPRIFDPYFTTKQSKGGTGLGLAVVRSMVMAHRGDIVVNSRPGEGTVFKVFLPVAAAEHDEPEKRDLSPDTGHMGQGELVVFVDDDPLIAEMAKKGLESMGYAVESFTDPEEAQQYLNANAGKIHILVTDLTMPRISGHKLVDYVRNLRPDLPIIICTGYADGRITEIVKKQPLVKLLYKPYTVEGLAAAIGDALRSG